jgi:transcription antitermination factor NusG
MEKNTSQVRIAKLYPKPGLGAKMRATISFLNDDTPQGDLSPLWFPVYVVSRHEKRVAEHFTVRQVEHFLPLYSKPCRWKDGSRIDLQLPLFPNYLFVKITHETRVRALEIPGVVSLVGYGRHASPVPDSYIGFLRDGLRLHRIEPHPYLAVGARVRIKAGPMAGLEGVLVRKKSDFRVVLTLDMIMKSVAVEVDQSDLEPVGPPPRRDIPSFAPAAMA